MAQALRCGAQCCANPRSVGLARRDARAPVQRSLLTPGAGGGARVSLARRAARAAAEDGSGGAGGAATAEKDERGPGYETEDLSRDIAKAVKKTATTFAPRASTKSKNPAVPGSALYTIFEVQAYASALLGGLLSYNLLFPSDDPDIWRLMGMWSVWMFTIPSLRARDCSDQEKTALNYLFLVVPLINVTLPLVWKSFAAVWTADVIAFIGFYAWKMEWLKPKSE